MINLPSSTFVGKVVPKEKFYSKCAVNTATKNLFVGTSKNTFFS